MRALLVVGSLAGAMLVGTAGPAAAAATDSPSITARWSLPTVDFMVTKASCLRYYRRDAAKCRRIPPIPYVRQACWAAAAAKLGACVARSNG